MTVVHLPARRPAPSPAAVGRHFTRTRALTVAVLLAGAGAIHVMAAPEHAAEYPLFGVAFYVMAGLQFFGATTFAAGRTGAALRRATIAVSLSIAALWAISRVVGLPIGPEPWVAEAIGAEDVLCTILELLAVEAILFAPLEARRLTSSIR
jgi:hypothetical protein